jgi:hypothetical protein
MARTCDGRRQWDIVEQPVHLGRRSLVGIGVGNNPHAQLSDQFSGCVCGVEGHLHGSAERHPGQRVDEIGKLDGDERGGNGGGPPAPASVSPNSGGGSSRTFAFTFTDPNGVKDIVSAQIDINAQLSATHACYFYYSRASNALYLANDAGAWQGPVTVGGTSTLVNS